MQNRKYYNRNLRFKLINFTIYISLFFESWLNLTVKKKNYKFESDVIKFFLYVSNLLFYDRLHGSMVTLLLKIHSVPQTSWHKYFPVMYEHCKRKLRQDFRLAPPFNIFFLFPLLIHSDETSDKLKNTCMNLTAMQLLLKRI